MKKIMISFSAALSVIAMSATHTYGAPAFGDLNGHWAKDAIAAAVSKGYVDGYPDNSFKPEQNVTRAEFIKLAVEAMRFAKGASSAGTQWYSPYLDAAIANGLSEDGEFSDFDNPITREEMSRIAVRGTGQANYDSLKWMYLATSNGIINGLDDQGTLGEGQPTTRAQAITVIERILKIRAGEKLPTDKYATSAAEIAWHRTNVYTMAPEYFGWGKDMNKPFRTDLLRYDGPNGFSEVEKYVIVDMGDPNDPNRKLIPEGMMWDKHYEKNYKYTKEVPQNAYAFLSFNHFVVDLDKDTSPFRFSHLTVLPFNSAPNNVDADGNLINVTGFALYEESRKTLLWGRTSLKTGHHDIRIVTGQLVPKGTGGKNGAGFGVNRQAAQELGEGWSTQVFDTQIDYSLIGRQ